jgi:hypothetical protein
MVKARDDADKRKDDFAVIEWRTGSFRGQVVLKELASRQQSTVAIKD